MCNGKHKTVPKTIKNQISVYIILPEMSTKLNLKIKTYQFQSPNEKKEREKTL